MKVLWIRKYEVENDCDFWTANGYVPKSPNSSFLLPFRVETYETSTCFSSISSDSDIVRTNLTENVSVVFFLFNLLPNLYKALT